MTSYHEWVEYTADNYYYLARVNASDTDPEDALDDFVRTHWMTEIAADAILYALRHNGFSEDRGAQGAGPVIKGLANMFATATLNPALGKAIVTRLRPKGRAWTPKVLLQMTALGSVPEYVLTKIRRQFEQSPHTIADFMVTPGYVEDIIEGTWPPERPPPAGVDPDTAFRDVVRRARQMAAGK